MISTGFTWGDKSLESKAQSPASRLAQVPRKRKQQHDDDSKVHKPSSNKRGYSSSSASSSSSSSSSSANPSSIPSTASNSSSFSSLKHKRVKTPKILGQSLPLNRVIEVLDHTQLQNLLQNLIQLHPEVSETVSKLSPKPNLSDSLKLMRAKYDNILSHLPYKCDMESDYSYLRIKPYLNEFFNCLSDFILHYLPPVEINLSTSLKFLDSITNLIHSLPNFSNHEFQYTKMMAYDQVVNCWMIVMTRDHISEQQHQQLDVVAEGSSSTPGPSSAASATANDDLISIIKDLDLKAKVQHHNENSTGKFKPVQSFIQSELDNYEMVNQHLSGSSINDLITMDYSNYSITARTSH